MSGDREGEETVVVTFKLPKKLLKILDDHVSSIGVTRSVYIRDAIRLKLARDGVIEDRRLKAIRIVRVDLGSNKPPEHEVVFTDGREICRNIKSMLLKGMSWMEISRKYKVSPFTIRKKYKTECLEEVAGR